MGHPERIGEYTMDTHEDLLEKWSLEPHHQGQCFIKDGIIENDRWRSADPRVLFLLKEGRHSGTGIWDLRKYIRESDPDQGTLRNTAYWCYAIHHIKRGRLPGLPIASKRTAEYRKAVEALRSSAIVNIKKSSGRSNSVPEAVRVPRTAVATDTDPRRRLGRTGGLCICLAGGRLILGKQPALPQVGTMRRKARIIENLQPA
jgi:hypothetical protein